MIDISVIIPTYKNRGSLENSIKSVLEQDYKGLLEIIVVDDNNPNTTEREATEKLMSRYKNDAKVIYIKHEKTVMVQLLVIPE